MSIIENLIDAAKLAHATILEELGNITNNHAVNAEISTSVTNMHAAARHLERMISVGEDHIKWRAPAPEVSEESESPPVEAPAAPAEHEVHEQPPAPEVSEEVPPVSER